jgi:hypothetical protein
MKAPAKASSIVVVLRRFFILVLCVLVGCAGPQTRTPVVSSVAAKKEAMMQKTLVVRSQMQVRNRLTRVGHQVLVAGAEICGENARPAYGFLVMSESGFDEDLSDAARAEGFDNSVKVSYVIPGFNAERSGLQVGDKLIKIGYWAVPQKKDSLEDALKKMRSKDKSVQTLALTVRRGDSELLIDVESDLACDYPVLLGESDDLNAYADGKNIIIEKGMMRFARGDEELGLIIAHELAHNAMGHIEAKKVNMLLGGVLGFAADAALSVATVGGYASTEFMSIGVAIGAGSYSVEFEQEADYVGMYFLKRSGYNGTDAPNFWRRMAVEHPGSIELRKSHPTTPERFIALEAAITEIDTKASAGQPLLPETKK